MNSDKFKKDIDSLEVPITKLDKIIQEEMRKERVMKKSIFHFSKPVKFSFLVIAALLIFFFSTSKNHNNEAIVNEDQTNLLISDVIEYDNVTELINNSDLIVRARVTSQELESIQIDSLNSDDMMYIVSEVKTIDTYKGQPSETETIKQLNETTDNNSYTLKEDEEYLLFLEVYEDVPASLISNQVFIINDDNVVSHQGDISFTLKEFSDNIKGN
ncbi:hypothetical protein MM326_18800 [Alkalihalobacillus sp. LMS6]|uniref:hypothetical protein n=1 Tax=Alkalihalobacillus sp. LMS6 TaxID=2924034 RepID=UPI0020D126E7|nr:hypothetical protein [Alkalihalobacillus sp. LMS6]UTR06101.1 hypothetical protein MM326_18800 [Alkalihalobacillus sp. LMS6]